MRGWTVLMMFSIAIIGCRYNPSMDENQFNVNPAISYNVYCNQQISLDLFKENVHNVSIRNGLSAYDRADNESGSLFQILVESERWKMLIGSADDKAVVGVYLKSGLSLTDFDNKVLSELETSIRRCGERSQ